ncbi:UNVERIFIED_CONTAM: hypothetical protein GTU68_025408 [Idotea baltica]|nr:hypothetical protein [Idotea baltica]
MSAAVRILVVDDHTLVRSGFRLLLEQIEGFTVIGEAENGQKALELIETEVPDVVIADIAMPVMTGLVLVATVRSRWPDVRCLLLSMHKTPQYVRSALEAGAAGYLLKDSVDSELETAVRTVVEGGSYLSPALSQTMIDGLTNRTGNSPGVLESLTARQIQVLTQIAEGFTTKQIALNLDVSPKTVETHRTQLMNRLGIFSVAELVRVAIREGLVAMG